MTEPISPDRLIRLPEVLRIIPVGKSTWHDGVREGRYPAPIKISPRVSCYRLSSILSLVVGGFQPKTRCDTGSEST